eukprot:6020738-Prorocentrum_lima.AAC.1
MEGGQLKEHVTGREHRRAMMWRIEPASIGRWPPPRCPAAPSPHRTMMAQSFVLSRGVMRRSVSYTHLTLPTICSV